VLSTLTAIGAVRLLHWIELETGWVSPVDPETARAVLGTMASEPVKETLFRNSLPMVDWTP